MNYQGGKGRIRRHLGAAVRALANGDPIVEPFCGGLSMTVELKPRIASDLSRPVITLVEAVRSGWRPPEEVSPELYARCRASKDEADPLTCFVGQCATFGGKWFGGLSKPNPPRNPHPHRTAARALLERVERLGETDFRHCGYDEIELSPRDTVYCDPPYEGTTASWPVDAFDHARFWQWARETSARGAMVLVSEFSAPADFVEVWSMARGELARDANGRVLERLFMAPS